MLFDCLIVLHGDDSPLSAFRIHLRRLSDGLPRVSALGDTPLQYVDYESKKILWNLDVLASRHRLVAIAAFDGTSYFGSHNTLVVWDWRSGERFLVRPSHLSIPHLL